jgi:D-tyrosyl-tRNA(Tyr) deacylase
MRAVVQRVSQASVTVDGSVVASIGTGFLVLLGVAQSDSPEDARYLAGKVAGLRIFEDEAGKMNRALSEVGGEVLVISQFTLLGDCRKGRRPSFTEAAAPEQAEALYQAFVEELRRGAIPVRTGRFQTHMHVNLTNDGPVTLLLDSRRLP